MVQISRRTLLGAGAALGAGPLLTACGSPFDDTTAAGGNVLEFVTFYTGPDGVVMQGIVDRYNEQSTGAQIRMSAPAYGGDYLTKLVTSSIAGNPPAIMALHNNEVPPLRRFLHELDLASFGFAEADFVEGTQDLGLVDGKRLGITMSTGPQAMVYNKRLFADAGLDPESPPADAREFLEAGKALKESGVWGFIREPAAWMPWLTMNWQNGGEIVAEDGTALFDSDASLEAIDMERRWVHEDGIAPSQLLDGVQMGQQFQDEQVGMIFIGPWGLADMVKATEEDGKDFGVAPLPAFFDAAPAVAATSHVYCIPKQRSNDDWVSAEAAKFIEWVVREGSVTWAGSQAPSFNGVDAAIAASDDPVVTAMTTFVAEQPRARFLPYVPRWNQAFTYLTSATQSIVYRNEDPQALMSQAAEQATAAIKGATR
ncbi:carbohydrate ABC transporter substrate-binding protein, CUT1 family [Glycomyces sambucus]|uniref:Carbohydrate ABC transporter substrate-binding protein, CUT1 family n=1 Tax=Glycomyces sambucus TaxID=380244 RepID=A0A1G9D4U1_9ACTN|nr:extracellular solute-binding protein [Glycomyces sambucus]SDK58877.1 carbohydrate ABC transporter substrate-binding protein, CUT1 family [Glycomyces sambucus]